MAARTVIDRQSLPLTQHGPGFSTRSLRGFRHAAIDPFLSLDEFHMSEPTFPPHPHAGFSAVTVMLEDSKGAFRNRDSRGDESRIGPGAIHWTQAARGVVHEEVPERPGIDSHGLQIFVNLSARDKLAAPSAFHLDGSEVPLVTPSVGARVRVLAGSFGDTRSPLGPLLTPVTLLDVRLEPGARLEVPAVEPMAFAMVLQGSGRTAGEDLEAHQAVGFGPGPEPLVFEAGPAGLQFIIGAGSPLREPVVFGGPFAMTSRAEVEAAFQRYQAGEMGALRPSF